MSKFKIILKYYLLEKKLLFIFLLFGVLVTVFDLLTPILVKEIIDVIMPSKNLERLMLFSGLALLFYILRAASLVISSSSGQLMGNKLKFRMRNDLVNHFLNQSNKFFHNKNNGELISRVTGDLENISTLLHRGLEDSISTVLSLCGSFFLMLKFSPTLAFYVFLPLPITIFFVYCLNKKLKKGYLNIRKENGNYISTLNDIFRIIFFIKDNNLEENNKNKIFKSNEKLLESEKKNFLNSSYLTSGIVFYTQFVQLLLIFVGGVLYIKDQMSLGIIFSFLLLVDRFKVSIMRFLGLIDLYQRGMVGITRFEEMLDLNTTLPDGKMDLNGKFESLEFKNVYFAYSEDKEYILKDVSFKISKGEKVAIFGKSGMGKTTIFNLIKRNYFPTKGNIYINGIDIKDIKKDSLLKIIGVINKENNLFNDSILENIRVINPDEISLEKIEEASKKACIHNKIISFPKKYQTILGVDGINLSHGEEQRISIARIFLKEAKLVMLDEATSGLDNLSENTIMKNIRNIFKDETVVTITHNFSLLKNYDKIILIENGVVQEEGNYSELEQKKSKFYEIISKKCD
ncbi:ABC transporter ATP-binding protein [Fusobacterium sp.]|uniref:ABC transporter ATP-binding protein n=1 Tax=Fusobacterium sp. TaxID=68766 RepID=UPI00262D2831|nr:ABC transporter ATP-binding protein [Fusobacterium sp.]